MDFPKTVFCDIDGVIFRHFISMDKIKNINPIDDLLPGAKELFLEWNVKGYRIVLTTGRPESFREITQGQIMDAGLFYHDLIMNLPRGKRVVINDKKPDGQETAAAFNLERNEGIKSVKI